LFNSLSEWFSSQKTNLTDSVARFNNRKFMDAAMAGCAMVAAADGSIDSDEKQKVAGFTFAWLSAPQMVISTTTKRKSSKALSQSLVFLQQSLALAKSP